MEQISLNFKQIEVSTKMPQNQIFEALDSMFKVLQSAGETIAFEPGPIKGASEISAGQGDEVGSSGGFLMNFRVRRDAEKAQDVAFVQELLNPRHRDAVLKVLDAISQQIGDQIAGGGTQAAEKSYYSITLENAQIVSY
jgi:hypothetical protein